MIRPDHSRNTLAADALSGAVRDLRQISQAEAQLLGSVNYRILPTPTLEPYRQTASGEAQPTSTRRLIEKSR